MNDPIAIILVAFAVVVIVGGLAGATIVGVAWLVLG